MKIWFAKKRIHSSKNIIESKNKYTGARRGIISHPGWNSRLAPFSTAAKSYWSLEIPRDQRNCACDDPKWNAIRVWLEVSHGCLVAFLAQLVALEGLPVMLPIELIKVELRTVEIEWAGSPCIAHAGRRAWAGTSRAGDGCEVSTQQKMKSPTMVISSPWFRVAEHGVGLWNECEFGRCLAVIRIHVRVM